LIKQAKKAVTNSAWETPFSSVRDRIERSASLATALLKGVNMIVIKRIIPALVLTGVSAMVGANVVLMQDGQRGGPPGGFMRVDRVLAALNANDDEIITAAELNNASAALKKLDQNGDGKLSADEVRPSFPGGRAGGRPGGRPGEEGRPGEGGRRGPGGSGEQARNSSDEMVQMLMEFDRNGDGKLAKAELPERMQGLFERSDANKDGLLTKEELKQSAESQAANAGGMRQGRSEGRPGEGRREEGRPGGPGGMLRSTPAFIALDADGDGEVSAAELNNATAALKQLDKNGDGNLSEDEVRPNFGGGRREGGERRPPARF
jgi:Ca2+-binding EF-hand superfamily protein